ncbi:DEAD-box ATP-dependent RNA helicase 5-like isoform X1 [Apium graveolens]|uniref:DEAD-box ATP-dependent RNA helicase 5-like isoform X1 n=1 Tax=Apium graveolens TaxID=4045 RepID=UPI003D793068
MKKIKKNHEECEKIDGSVQDCDGEVRESNEGIVISRKDVNDSKFMPLKSFEEAGLRDEVLECCKTFDKPSPIQANSWRFLLEGRDFIGIVKTGPGKTLAFTDKFRNSLGNPAQLHHVSRNQNEWHRLNNLKFSVNDI